MESKPQETTAFGPWVSVRGNRKPGSAGSPRPAEQIEIKAPQLEMGRSAVESGGEMVKGSNSDQGSSKEEDGPGRGSARKEARSSGCRHSGG